MQGEVIGINTMILSNSSGMFGQGGNIGIGFAISSNVARVVFKQLVSVGRVTRGYLGVNVLDLDAAKAHALCLPASSGVLVNDVNGNTPAAKAGLRSLDVITTFAGKAGNAARAPTEASP